MQRFLQQEIDLNHIPGAVISVSYQDDIILQEAFGHRVVHPEKSPMTLDTVFDLASLTKVVATLPAILKLIDRGDVRLDDPVAHFLPEFAQQGKEKVTLKHLLTHTSGLPDHQPYYKENLSAENIIKRIYATQLVAPLGKQVIYSDLGYITLYKVVEHVTGENFADFVEREIFTPLQMNESVFNPTFENERYAVTEYADHLADYKQGVVHDENAEALGGISGHAGLFSTISDLQNFAQMIENNGVFENKQLLSWSALNTARQNYTMFSSEYRGIGWMLKDPQLSSSGDYFAAESYGHTGFTGTSIWFDPTIQLHVILLTNRVHFGRQNHIIRLRPRLHNLIRAQL